MRRQKLKKAFIVLIDTAAVIVRRPYAPAVRVVPNKQVYTRKRKNARDTPDERE
jgi:hypothetical protein